MKNKLMTRIIAIILCLVTVGGIVAGVIGGLGNNDDEVTAFLKTTARVSEAQIQAAVEKHAKKDFALSSLLDIMGVPKLIMFNFGGPEPQYYTAEADISAFLRDYASHPFFNENVIIQLSWMDETDNVVFTVIAAEFEEPTIIGLMRQATIKVEKGSFDVPRTKKQLSDFTEYNADTLNAFSKAVLSSVQYPLLECHYTKTYLTANDFTATWTTKVIQNNKGLVYILLKNGEPYQIYQDIADRKLPTYQKSDKLKSGLNEKQFLKIYPKAVKIQMFNHEENNLEYYIVTYAIMETDKNGKTEKKIYNIVDNDLYVYDENGNLMNPESGLVIEKDSFKPGK